MTHNLVGQNLVGVGCLVLRRDLIDRLDLRPLDRHQGRDEGTLQHVIDGRDRDDLQALFDVVRNLGQMACSALQARRKSETAFA